jgi:dTDP-4-dehydrorhamnose reductase
MIHASTDCIFSGETGRHRTDDLKDAQSTYGFSKALGEAVALDPRVYCLRVSLVGPELNGGRGLLGWFLQQPGAVDGFTNHRWNGITTLEWARTALGIIQGTLPFSTGVTQLGVEAGMSKFELLTLFAEVWAPGKEVRPTAAAQNIDRTLVPDVVSPPIREQLLELREWMLSTTTPSHPMTA